MSKNDNKRTFIGFTISPEDQQRLIDIQQLFSEKINPSATIVPSTNLHITAAFLGQTSPEAIQDVDSFISSRSFKRCSQKLQHIAYWPNAEVLCIEGKPDDEIAFIASQLALLAKQLNLYQSQYEYRPHISLFRQVRLNQSAHLHDDELPNESFHLEGLKAIAAISLSAITINPITIKVTELTLFESNMTASGVKYIPLKSWPLT